MQRAALYARVSTKAQKDEGTSLDTQLEEMRAWAKDNGYEIACEFSEDFTGTEIGRPELNRLKDSAQTGAIDAVLVYAWDRLARDADDQVLLRVFFERECRVELVCTTQPQMGEMATMVYRTIMGLAAQIENDMRRERSMRGIRRAAIEKGQLPSGGQGLYGYDYSAKSRGGDGKRTINEEEARVVDLIFRWFVEEKLTIYRIAKRLEEMGILTKKGKEKWCYSVLDRLLRNPAYCGKTYAYRWETVEPKNPLKASRRSKKSSTRLRPQEEWIELNEGSTPAIVSEELWKAAQKRLKESFKMRREPKYPYLLRGMVRCHCGKKMAACSISEERRYYRCSAKSGVDPSHHFLVPAQILEDEVWGQLVEILTDQGTLFRFLEKDAEDENGVLRERMAEVEKAIADLDEAESRAISLYSSGKIDRRKIDKRIDRIVAEREARVEDLADWEKRLQTKLQLQGSKERILEWLELKGGGRDEVSLRIGERLDDLLDDTLEERSFIPKHELLRMLDLRVYMKAPDVEVVEWKDKELPLERMEIPADSSLTYVGCAHSVADYETGEIAAARRKVWRRPARELCFLVVFDLASICTIFPTPSPWGSQNPHPPPSPTGIL